MWVKSSKIGKEQDGEKYVVAQLQKFCMERVSGNTSIMAIS